MKLTRNTRPISTALGVLALALTTSIPAGSEARVPRDHTFVAALAMGEHWASTVVVINGQPLRFIVDTAAEGTVIDRATATRLGLRTSGKATVTGASTQSEAVKVRAARFELGGAIHHDLQLIVTDMGQFGGSYSGILGNDVLRKFSVLLDVPSERLELSDEELPSSWSRWRCVSNSRPGRGRDIEGFAFVAARPSVTREAGRGLFAVLDSGAARTTLNWPAARILGITQDDPRLTLRPKSSRGINSSGAGPTSHSFELPKLTINGWTAVATDARITDLAVFKALGVATTPALIVGIDILKQSAFGISKGAKKICMPQPHDSKS